MTNYEENTIKNNNTKNRKEQTVPEIAQDEAEYVQWIEPK